MPSTSRPARARTLEDIDTDIRRQTENRVSYFAEHTDEIDQRLDELDAEWDLERATQAKLAAAGLGGAVLGLIGGRKWLMLSAVASGFMLQHARQGRCAPMDMLRRLGLRTANEIGDERAALKMLRGDFAGDADDEAKPRDKARAALAAVSAP